MRNHGAWKSSAITWRTLTRLGSSVTLRSFNLAMPRTSSKPRHARHGNAEDIGGGVWFRGTETDFSPGSLKRPALIRIWQLTATVFFVIERDGQEMLTRAGNFLFNSDGQLVTQDGDAVLSDAGTPIVIDARLPWAMTPDGAIQQGTDKIPLAINRAAQPGDLTKIGENLFQALAPAEPLPAEMRDVRSGYLEMSGVKTDMEMLEMIETTAHSKPTST